MPFLTLLCASNNKPIPLPHLWGKKKFMEKHKTHFYMPTEWAQLILLLFLQSDLPNGIWNNAISFFCQHSLPRQPLTSLQYILTYTCTRTPKNNWCAVWPVQLSMPRVQQDWFSHEYQYGQERCNKHITLLESNQPPQYQWACFGLTMFLRPVRKRLFGKNILLIIMYCEKSWPFFFSLFKREFEQSCVI